MFVSDHFDVRLDEIADSKATRTAADNLIEYLEERGEEVTLILALHKERLRNPEVQTLMNRLQGFLQRSLVLDPRGLYNCLCQRSEIGSNELLN